MRLKAKELCKSSTILSMSGCTIILQMTDFQVHYPKKSMYDQTIVCRPASIEQQVKRESEKGILSIRYNDFEDYLPHSGEW